jgi:hypothetical protein
MKAYAPAKQVDKKGTPTAYQAAADPSKLFQNCAAVDSGPPKRPRGVCWDCGSKDHFRGAPTVKGLPTLAPAVAVLVVVHLLLHPHVMA